MNSKKGTIHEDAFIHSGQGWFYMDVEAKGATWFKSIFWAISPFKAIIQSFRRAIETKNLDMFLQWLREQLSNKKILIIYFMHLDYRVIFKQ